MICSFRLDPDGAVILTEHSEIESFLSTQQGRLLKENSLLETLLHPKDSARVLREIQDAGSQLADWQSEFRLKPAEKGVIWIKSHFLPARQDDGSIVFAGVMFDTTIPGYTAVSELHQGSGSFTMELLGTSLEVYPKLLVGIRI